MSAPTAIGMVSESLRNLLLTEMSLSPPVNITILGPDESGGDRRVNLFLYRVQENAALKNQDWHVKSGAPNQLSPPPLSLSLFYLMTAYAPNDMQTGNSVAHEILGDAMRVFYENAIVPETTLATGLQGSRERIQIIPNSVDMEELGHVWGTFTQPFRLSVLYEVSVVQLDMLASRERAMAERVRTVGIPGVEAPFAPPVVLAMTPPSGPPGTEITFQGPSLPGWRAYVTVLGRSMVDGVEITDESFTATIPADLLQGFHEIRVDISHLFKRVFFFEVTS